MRTAHAPHVFFITFRTAAIKLETGGVKQETCNVKHETPTRFVSKSALHAPHSTMLIQALLPQNFHALRQIVAVDMFFYCFFLELCDAPHVVLKMVRSTREALAYKIVAVSDSRENSMTWEIRLGAAKTQGAEHEHLKLGCRIAQCQLGFGEVRS